VPDSASRREFLKAGSAAGVMLGAARLDGAQAARPRAEDLARLMTAPDETKQVADALSLPVAGGEQDSSLRRFRWMIEHRAVDIVQPDLFYFGGSVRSIRVARMAAGMECTPHMSDGGLGYLYVAHFASCVPNAGPFQEYKGRDEALPVSSDTSTLNCVVGVLKVPGGPGLGVVIDPGFVAKGELIR
jgi:L-alanine-DL-glutamate epimerase-like enolase superfamily enzyme